MINKIVILIIIVSLESCVTFMTLPTWTEKGGCPIYSGVRAGCDGKSKPISSLEFAITYYLSLPFTFVADTILLPVSIPFGFGNTVYYGIKDWRANRKAAEIYEHKFPLHYAAEFNQKEKVKVLLKQGANFNAPDSNGRTPIDAAINGKNYEVAVILLEYGARLEEPNMEFFEYLTEQRNYKKIETISEHRPNIKNDFLFFAVTTGNSTLVNDLIRINANVNYIRRYPILVWAYITGNFDIIKTLVEKGADVNIHYEDSGEISTPFFRIVCDYRNQKLPENLERIRFLLKNGAKVGNLKKDKEEAIVLYEDLLGSPSNDIPILLLENGLNANEKGYNGKNLLQAPIDKGDIKVIKYLNEHGAPIKKLDKSYRTSSFLSAIREQRIETVKWFLDTNNADVKSIRDVALYSSNMEITKLLVEKGAEINAKRRNKGYTNDGFTFLANAVWNNQPDIVEYLVSKNADIYELNDNKETLLFFITEHKNTNMAKYLIGKGLDVNAKNSKGETVILKSFSPFEDTCSLNPNLELVRLLIDHHADLNAQDYAGHAAIHCAAVIGSIDALRFLLRNGANINLRDKAGLSALDYAERYNHTLVRYYLKLNGAE
ncbi:ankyrin repeat domain-containing protein [Leptospira alstonii]|nr:ankyrin repeat domain-containing protein [Leptospira alstonii]